MVWKLLLTVAVLGTLLSLVDCECSDESDCGTCKTCDTSDDPTGSCVPKSCDGTQECNYDSGNCEATCASDSECDSSLCEICDTSTSPSFCVTHPDCDQEGYGCNGNTGYCEELLICEKSSDCKSVCGKCNSGYCTPKKCDTGYGCNGASGNCEVPCSSDDECRSSDKVTNCTDDDPVTCSPNGFCQSCPFGQNCLGGTCYCVVARCEEKCGKRKYCCSGDSKTCNCCEDKQTCYQVTGKRDQDQSSSWALRMLHMEKASVLSRTCQNTCTDDPSKCDATNCETCGEADADGKKVCLPCTATANCNSEGGQTACCTQGGCTCCEAWETCYENSCQCDETACNSVKCGSCDPIIEACVPNGKCADSDPGLACNADGMTCECNEGQCDSDKAGECDLSYQDSCCGSRGCGCYDDDEGECSSKKKGNVTGIAKRSPIQRPAMASL